MFDEATTTFEMGVMCILFIHFYYLCMHLPKQCSLGTLHARVGKEENSVCTRKCCRPY
jgi:hypothetical protein